MCRPVQALAIALALLCCFSSLSAQSSQIDSLTNLLSNHKEEDTLKLNLLVELTKYYYGTDPRKGVELGKEAILLSERLGKDKQSAMAHYRVGISYDNSSQPKLALDHYRVAAALFDSLQMKEYLAFCYAKMSVVHKYQGEYEEAMTFVKRAKEINEERNDSTALGFNLNNIGQILNDLGQLDQAMNYFEQALSIRKQLKDTLTTSHSMVSISLVLIGHGKYDEALEYLYPALTNFEHLQDTLSIGEALYLIGIVKVYNEQYVEAQEDLKGALLMFEAIDNKYMIAKALTVIGGALTEIGDFDEAIAKYNQALSVAEEFNYRDDAALIFTNLAYCYGKMEQYKDALDYGLKALELQEAINDPTGILNSLRTIADIYLKMEDYDQAIIYSNKALTVFDDENRYNDLALIHETAYKAYRAKGDYRKAFEHLSGHMVANDSLFNVEKSTEIANLTSVHDLKEQESENEVLLLNQALGDATIQRQNNLILGAILIIVILVILAFVVYRGLVQRRRTAIKLTSLNDELNAANDRLEQHDQYRTRMFANINHDFRSPLTLIKGYVDRMAANETNFLSKETEEDMVHLRENANMLVNMTGQIQNLIKLDERKLSVQWNKIEVVSVISSIHKMYDSLSDVQGKRLDLIVDTDEFVIHADLSYFRKILYNLISNAFRYTSTGDLITIEVRNTGAQAEIRVADTGQGIDAAHLPYIFDRFYQVPDHDYKSVEGFGIGLALVKELVGLHKGNIEVESEPGRGTTFTLTLPHNLDKPTTAPQEESAPVLPSKRASANTQTANPPITNKEHTLLVVDDHDEIRHYIASSLSQTYVIRQAVHGKEALEILEKEKIDLIITDLMMPWLDGFELIDEVRQSEKWQHIPVMVVSARTTEEDKLKVLDSGVNDFIAKPFDLAELAKKVENHIGAIDKARKNTWQAVAENKDIRSNLERNILKKINQLIIDRIEDPGLKVEDIAEEISASQRKTFNLLKSLTGQSPQAYIKNIRLDYAHQLIVSGKLMNAAEAAKAIGMKNSTHFKKQYLDKFGVVPFGEPTATKDN